MSKEELTLEQGFEKLDEIIGQLEDREIPLEKSFQLYEEGVALLKGCNDKIDRVEKQVQKLNSDNTLSDFEEE
ncbi:MAG: exodeoxyribonuclease VII small subunit [Lachnospiraceae bacterium]|nr:exodeoxyribonuclease VII small subunit [Lachnospiraceae bacterium]